MQLQAEYREVANKVLVDEEKMHATIGAHILPILEKIEEAKGIYGRDNPLKDFNFFQDMKSRFDAAKNARTTTLSWEPGFLDERLYRIPGNTPGLAQFKSLYEDSGRLLTIIQPEERRLEEKPHDQDIRKGLISILETTDRTFDELKVRAAAADIKALSTAWTAVYGERADNPFKLFQDRMDFIELARKRYLGA